MPLPSHKIHKLGRRLDSRARLIGGWLRRRAAYRLAEQVGEDQELAARYLARAVAGHADPRVREISLNAIRDVTGGKCLNVVAGVWAKTRDASLRRVVEDNDLLARSPPELRVLTALAIGRPQPVTQGGPAVAAPLIEACRDDDPEIAARARKAFGKLSRQDTIDELCEQLVLAERPRQLQLALDAGYRPSDPRRQALFLFMTGQWDAYSDLDFDQRLMQAVYESADEPLRRRITEKLRISGRADLLPLVTGGDRLSRVARMTPAEADFLIDMTARHRMWDKLWRLVFEFPVGHSARALLELNRAEWRPEAADERLIFDQLLANAERAHSMTATDLRQALPPAVECERLAMPGRINAVAFSPARSIVAIGTGTGRVVLWDFHLAERAALYRDFDHSIGRVSFTADDTLVCGERSALRDAECAVVALAGDQRRQLTSHSGPVTALEPLGGSKLLSAGRDHRLLVLNATDGSLLEEEIFYQWPRALRVSPNGERVVVLHKSVTTLSLPHFDDEMRTFGHPHPGVSRCADFAPDGKTVIVGKHNGHVDVFQPRGQRLYGQPQSLAHYPGPVQAVQSLAARGIVITAAGNGRVDFTAWENRQRIGEIIVPGERLTSLTVSPDGMTMAIGDSDASLTLWDLRPLDFPELFSRPLARSTPGHLAVAAELCESSKIDGGIQPGLEYVRDVLKHRFRYDVEIADVPTIRMGEFDIALD